MRRTRKNKREQKIMQALRGTRFDVNRPVSSTAYRDLGMSRGSLGGGFLYTTTRPRAGSSILNVSGPLLLRRRIVFARPGNAFEGAGIGATNAATKEGGFVFFGNRDRE